MTFYYAKLTQAGTLLLAAAQGASAVPLTQMVIGDGGGAGYDPTGAETALVNVRDTQGIDSAGVDPEDGSIFYITGIFPAENGGYTAREVGVRTADGTLFAIARIPALVKPDPSDGAGIDMVVTLRLKFSGDPNITIIVDPSSIYATRSSVWLARHYFALKGAPQANPPASPNEQDIWLVPNDGATGAWVGHNNQIAIYTGGGWAFITPPYGARAAVGQTSTVYRRTAAGWVIDTATTLETAFSTLKARRRLMEKELTDFTFLPTTTRAVTTGLTDIAPQGLDAATPEGQVRVAYVRFANVGDADHYADLKIVDTSVIDGSNDGYRAKNFPVGFNESGSAPDFERKLVLTAGQKLQHKGSGNNQLVVSIVWLQADAGVFLATTQRTASQAVMQYMGPHGAASVKTPVGKVRTLTLRACNIGGVDGTLDLKIVDESVGAGANDGYRRKSFPIPYAAAGSAPDFERVFVLTAGQKLGYQASGDNLIALSGEWAEDNA